MNSEIEQKGALCLVRSQNRILFVHQAYGLRLWTFPGGAVEQGESYSAAAIRELKEETGRIGKVKSLVCFRTCENQTIAIFSVDILGGDALEFTPGEIDAVRWFDEEEMKKEKQIMWLSQYVALKSIAEKLHPLGFEVWTAGGITADMFI